MKHREDAKLLRQIAREAGLSVSINEGYWWKKDYYVPAKPKHAQLADGRVTVQFSDNVIDNGKRLPRAKVSWSSIGARHPTQAKAIAAALNHAAVSAEAWNQMADEHDKDFRDAIKAIHVDGPPGEVTEA